MSSKLGAVSSNEEASKVREKCRKIFKSKCLKLNALYSEIVRHTGTCMYVPVIVSSSVNTINYAIYLLNGRYLFGKNKNRSTSEFCEYVRTYM
jgi:hypothetical protein